MDVFRTHVAGVDVHKDVLVITLIGKTCKRARAKTIKGLFWNFVKHRD